MREGEQLFMTLTFYKQGDFYEARNRDAQTIAFALGLPITSRVINNTTVKVSAIPAHRFTEWTEQLKVVGHEIILHSGFIR